MSEHHRFEIMCALAVSGQLTEQELQDLEMHSAQCVDCRRRIVDMTQLSAQALFCRGVKDYGCTLPRGMTERFVIRAGVEGIPLQAVRPRSLTTLNRFGGLAAALVAILIVVNLFGPGLRKPSSFTETTIEAHAVLATSKPNSQAMELSKKKPQARLSHVKRAAASSFAVPGSVNASNRTEDPAFDVSRVYMPSLERTGFHHDFRIQAVAFGDSGLRQFKYDPSAVDATRQVSYLGSNVDWYSVWVENRKTHTTDFDISVQ
jgi:hypothetical protein